MGKSCSPTTARATSYSRELPVTEGNPQTYRMSVSFCRDAAWSVQVSVDWKISRDDQGGVYDVYMCVLTLCYTANTQRVVFRETLETLLPPSITASKYINHSPCCVSSSVPVREKSRFLAGGVLAKSVLHFPDACVPRAFHRQSVLVPPPRLACSCGAICSHGNGLSLTRCLEDEMNLKHDRMKLVARQSQLLSSITELAVSLRRPPQDVVPALFLRLQVRVKSTAPNFYFRVQLGPHTP